MDEKIIKWIWQHPNYPSFEYDKDKLKNLIANLDYYRGILDGISKLFSVKDILKIEIDALTDEAINFNRR